MIPDAEKCCTECSHWVKYHTSKGCDCRKPKEALGGDTNPPTQ